MPFSKWNALVLSLKCFITTIIATVCAMTVAHAAPAMPISRPNMNTGSRTALKSTVNMVSAMAFFGCPEDLMAAFRPKYRWVMMLPIRMICMYSFA